MQVMPNYVGHLTSEDIIDMFEFRFEGNIGVYRMTDQTILINESDVNGRYWVYSWEVHISDTIVNRKIKEYIVR